ncbi:serine/Arginine-related protein 53-like [Cygnus atratus]|uniref:serine/Arginine-related protein 53-like n=1 Tax=Cygnus atratus TaxID=8868 RepID=UPI0021B74CBB|nr:serine/Arginine-related protein 53-like [Cygnus atratus]XP_050572928.1 serine/Arginine-related protein 53-like [Cygnus atratus]
MEPSLSNSSMAAATERESYQAASTTKRFDCWRSFEGNPGKMSRSRSRSPRRRAHTPERRREERSVPTAYRISNSPGNSRKRARSKSPHEKKKKRRSRSRTKSKARSPSPAVSQANHPHTKILCIQLVSLLWRAGNPARNAPGEFLRKKMAKSLQRSCLQCRVKSLRILWPK